MKIRMLIALLAVSGALAPRPSAAQIVVVGQDRRATASTFVNSSGDFDQEQHSEVAPDTAPFDVSLFADAVIADATATSLAEQVSTITTVSLNSAGSATASAEILVGGATAYSSSQSNVAIRFTLLQPSAYSLLGTMESAGEATMTVQLSRPFQTVAWFSATDELVAVDQTGILEGGTYDLNVTCGSVASPSAPGGVQQGSGSYDIRFLLGQATDNPVVAGAPVEAFPNPFRESVRLSMPADAREVRILDAGGRLVRTLSGASSVLFDGRDAAGRPIPSGVYWAKPVGGADATAIRIVRLR